MSESAKRVLARYLEAAVRRKPVSPEKLQALMLKLRKGHGLDKMRVLMPVFEHLGWRFDEVHVYNDPKGFDFGKPGHVGDPRPDVAREMWEEAKKAEVSTLPDPDNLKLNTMLYQDVGEFREVTDGNGWSGFKARQWQVVRGVKITSPNGKSFTAYVDPDLFDGASAALLQDKMNGRRFPKFLEEEGEFFKQINQALDLPSVEEEKKQKERQRIDERVRTTGKGVGTCSCCFGTFKLTPKTKKGRDKSMPGIVLHGYQRPGVGYILGDCFGMEWPPFELSAEGTEEYIEYLKGLLRQIRERIARLERRDQTEMLDPGSRSLAPVKKEDVDPVKWKRWQDDLISKANGQETMMLYALKTCEKNLAGWKPQPLPGTATAV